MYTKTLSFFLILLLPLSFVPFLTPSVAQAQSATPAVCTNPSTAEIAQACADYVAENKVLAALQAQLNQQKAKSGSLKKNVNGLIAQIGATQSKISGEISTINTLSLEIGQKQKAIGDLNSELDRQHASMAQLITRTDEIDQKGAEYVLLSANSISNFYQDLDDFFSIKQSLYGALTKVKQIRTVTQTQEQQLQDKQFQALDAKNALLTQKNQLATNQKQVQQLLNTSLSQQQQQAALVLAQQKKVAVIQSKLFSFAGGATSAIPFSQAYVYATAASGVTGVRPAFILAILTQESSLGRNVGTCNRAGDPPSKSYLNVMNPRDQPAFLRITAALGLNPNTTPVSCPIGTGGWGGAMGPAQFIPSTWEAVSSQVASALGKSASNPWSAQDAFMASAIYLQDRGATGGETNERNAACKYYSGRSCDGRNPPNSFYGNSVMALTRSIQADIDYLVQYGVSRRK